MYKHICLSSFSGKDEPFDPRETGFMEVWELHEFATGVLGQQSVVIDADDLCSDPGE